MHDLRRRGSPTWQRVLGCSLALIVGGAPSAPAEPGEDDRILVGIDYSFPPVQWIDEHGEPRGMEVDLLRAVADLEGLRLEFRGGHKSSSSPLTLASATCPSLTARRTWPRR